MNKTKMLEIFNIVCDHSLLEILLMRMNCCVAQFIPVVQQAVKSRSLIVLSF